MTGLLETSLVICFAVNVRITRLNGTRYVITGLGRRLMVVAGIQTTRASLSRPPFTPRPPHSQGLVHRRVGWGGGGGGGYSGTEWLPPAKWPHEVEAVNAKI